MKNKKQCPICGYEIYGYPFNECQCGLSMFLEINEAEIEVVLHHLYMLSKKQLRHIIKLEKSWQISYPDTERTDMLEALSHEGMIKWVDGKIWRRSE